MDTLKCQHITVLFRNIPGEFADVARRLQDENINIIAFHVADSGSKSGYAQLVCSDQMKALVVLKGHYGTSAYTSEVIAIRTKDVPGSLYAILSHLFVHKINIETAYQTLDAREGAIIIIEPSRSDMDRAKEAFVGWPGLIEDFSEIGSN
jgi:hypothetical protein